MGLIVRATYDICEVPNGTGGTFLGQQQANIPGQGQSNIPHLEANGPTLRFIAMEPVPVAPTSEGSVTLANIKTAIDACGTDVAGAGSPFINAAYLAQIQGWATGGA